MERAKKEAEEAKASFLAASACLLRLARLPKQGSDCSLTAACIGKLSMPDFVALPVGQRSTGEEANGTHSRGCTHA
jgi:hypothetical protein